MNEKKPERGWTPEAIIVAGLAFAVGFILIATPINVIIFDRPLNDQKLPILNSIIDSALAIVSFYIGFKGRDYLDKK